METLHDKALLAIDALLEVEPEWRAEAKKRGIDPTHFAAVVDVLRDVAYSEE